MIKIEDYNYQMIKQFINGLKYIKAHNSKDVNTNSLNFDDPFSNNLPSIDLDNLIHNFSGTVWVNLNLTWRDNEVGTFILPNVSHVSNDDALSVNELLPKFEKLFNEMPQPRSAISQKSFNQIKLVARILSKEVKQDNEAFELDNLPDEEDIEDKLGKTLGEFMDSNDDLMEAANLNIYYGDSEELAFTQDKDVISDECLNIPQLLDKVRQLIKLGRKGIKRLINRNNELGHEILKLNDKMNTID